MNRRRCAHAPSRNSTGRSRIWKRRVPHHNRTSRCARRNLSHVRLKRVRHNLNHRPNRRGKNTMRPNRIHRPIAVKKSAKVSTVRQSARESAVEKKKQPFGAAFLSAPADDTSRYTLALALATQARDRCKLRSGHGQFTLRTG